MLRILFLVLLLVFGSWAALAQTPEDEQSPKDPRREAEKITEVELTTNEHLAALLDNFLLGDLKKDPSAEGYIINYGSDREVARLESFIKSRISLLKFDSSGIRIVRAGYRQERKTEFWVVRPGILPPEIGGRPHKIDFFGRVTRSDFEKRFTNFLVRLRENPTNTGYIIIDGPAAYFARRQKLIMEAMRRRFPTARILITRGRTSGEPETQLWLLPAGTTGYDIERFEKEI